jgi:hypothetical protein
MPFETELKVIRIEIIASSMGQESKRRPAQRLAKNRCLRNNRSDAKIDSMGKSLIYNRRENPKGNKEIWESREMS